MEILRYNLSWFWARESTKNCILIVLSASTSNNRIFKSWLTTFAVYTINFRFISEIDIRNSNGKKKKKIKNSIYLLEMFLRCVGHMNYCASHTGRHSFRDEQYFAITDGGIEVIIFRGRDDGVVPVVYKRTLTVAISYLPRVLPKNP